MPKPSHALSAARCRAPSVGASDARRVFKKVSSKANSGFDRQQADGLVAGLHRPAQVTIRLFRPSLIEDPLASLFLDMNRLLTISDLETIGEGTFLTRGPVCRAA